MEHAARCCHTGLPRGSHAAGLRLLSASSPPIPTLTFPPPQPTAWSGCSPSAPATASAAPSVRRLLRRPRRARRLPGCPALRCGRACGLPRPPTCIVSHTQSRLLLTTLTALGAVPIYDSLGESAVEYIVKHSGAWGTLAGRRHQLLTVLLVWYIVKHSSGCEVVPPAVYGQAQPEPGLSGLVSSCLPGRSGCVQWRTPGSAAGPADPSCGAAARRHAAPRMLAELGLALF